MAEKPALRFGIIGKPNEPRAAAATASIAKWARRHSIQLLVDPNIPDIPEGARHLPEPEIAASVDALIVLGGDGTMIAASRFVAGRPVPVVGINLGWLGYLTEFAVEDTEAALESLLSGNYELDRRTMLDWELTRSGARVGGATVLNDVVVNKSALARVIEIDCLISDRAVTTYRGDGLIVATPTGSTAYNLSAGGPIIYLDTRAICISPICPHTLTNRPIVLPDSLEVELRVDTREQEVMLTSDGQTGLHLMSGDIVKIKKCPSTFNTVRPKDRDYFHILRDKLKWGG